MLSMFDLAGLKAMGETIDTFTRQTHAALLDIDQQLRIANALTAWQMAEDGYGHGEWREVISDALDIARDMPDLPPAGERSGS